LRNFAACYLLSQVVRYQAGYTGSAIVRLWPSLAGMIRRRGADGEGVHDRRLISFFTAHGPVQRARRLVARIGKDPGLGASEPLRFIHQSLNQPPCKSTTPVVRSDSHFIDELLRPLVRVYIVHGTRHADDPIVIDGDRKVMALVGKKLLQQT